MPLSGHGKERQIVIPARHDTLDDKAVNWPIRLILLCLAITLAAFFYSALAIGQWGAPVVPSRDIEDARQSLRKAKTARIAAHNRRLELENRASKAVVTADKYSAQIALLTATVRKSEADLEESEARLKLINRLQEQQSAELASRQTPMLKLNSALTSFARRPAILTLVQPGQADDMVHIRALMSSISPEIEKRTQSIRADLSKSRALRKQERSAANSLRDSRAQLLYDREELAKMENQERQNANSYRYDALLEEEREIGLGEKERDITKLIDDIGDDASTGKRLAGLDGPLLRPTSPGKGVVSKNNPVDLSHSENKGQQQKYYQLPVQGKIVTGFGEISDSGIKARGISLAPESGANIATPAAGKVVYAAPYRSFGLITIIDHGGGWFTLITGMSKLHKTKGEKVNQGDSIGEAPLENPLITVELRRQGKPVDILRMAE